MYILAVVISLAVHLNFFLQMNGGGILKLSYSLVCGTPSSLFMLKSYGVGGGGFSISPSPLWTSFVFELGWTGLVGIGLWGLRDL